MMQMLITKLISKVWHKLLFIDIIRLVSGNTKREAAASLFVLPYVQLFSNRSCTTVVVVSLVTAIEQ